MIERDTQNWEYQSKLTPRVTVKEAIEELNQRLLMGGVAYKYVAGRLIRSDSEFAFSEVVRPTLSLLENPRFAGANDEFVSAFAHYRKGKTKECLNDCLKALESTLKTICGMRGWKYSTGATAKDLIGVVIEKGLIPAFLLTHFSSVRAALESGVPTVRNKMSAHGQGEAPVEVPSYFGAYMLHLAATNILFLVNAERNTR